MDVRPTSSLASLKIPEAKASDKTKEVNKDSSTEKSASVVELSGLESAVSNTREASSAIKQVAKAAPEQKTEEKSAAARREVEESNRASTEASVSDVIAAADLARELASNIVGNQQQAFDAQAAAQKPESVSRLTS